MGPDGTGLLSWPAFPSPALSVCLLSSARRGTSLTSLSVMVKTMPQRALGGAVPQTNNSTKDTFAPPAAVKLLNYCRE